MSHRIDWMAEIHPENPYSGFPAHQFRPDLQGWGFESPIFEHVISTFRPSRMIEVGSWKGASANRIAQLMKQYALPKPQLVCVDTWLGSVEHWINQSEPTYVLNFQWGRSNLYNQFLANVVHCGNEDVIIPFPSDSSTAAKFFIAKGMLADAIYIDAGHEYESVMADLVAYWKVLKPGGVLIGDDYVLGWIGVVRAVHDFAERFDLTVNVSFGHKYLIEKPTVARDGVARKHDAAVLEHDAPAAALDALTRERDVAIAERDALAAALDALTRERDAAVAERDAESAASARWFDAVIAVTADHNPLAAPRKQRLSLNIVRGLIRKYGKPSTKVLADRARNGGKWELAIRYYRDVLDIEPENPKVWEECGHALTKTGKISEGQMAFQRARDLAMKRARSRMKERSRVARAAQAYRKAVKFNRSVADAHPLHALKEQVGTDDGSAANHPGLASNPPLPTTSQFPDTAPRIILQPVHYYIRTTHRTYLCLDKSTGRVQHKTEVGENGVPLLYFELESGTRCGFLTPAGSLDSFLCGDVLALGGVLPVRRIQLSGNAVAFQHISNNALVCAEGEPSANVTFDRQEAREWEMFSLHRVRWVPLPRRRALAAALVSMLTEPPCVQSYADRVLSYRGKDRDALVAFCLDRLGLDDFVALLDSIRAQLAPESLDAGLLRRLLVVRSASIDGSPLAPLSLAEPTDAESAFWVDRVLPNLLGWQRDRERCVGPDHHVQLYPDLDFLAHLQDGISIRTTSRLYNFLARFSTTPSRGICAIATARNEGVYLLEWLSYHKSIGIETFFIYSNNNDDGSDALLKRLSQEGAINWLESIVERNTVPQFKAYNHALNVLPHVLDYRWALVLDLDEFLVVNPDRFNGLSDYVSWQEQQPVDAIGFNWVWMSSSGQNKWSPDFVRNRFTQRYVGESPFVLQRRGGPDRHIKSMFRPQRFLSSQCHHPVTDWRVPIAVRDSSGYPHLNYYGGDPPFSLHPRAEAAWINHYFYKSTEEFVWKRSRNTGDHEISADLLTPFWLKVFASQHSSTDLFHDDQILHCGHCFQECYDALLNINGVLAIHEEIRDIFNTRLKRMKAELLNNSALYNHDDELVRQFLDCLKD